MERSALANGLPRFQLFEVLDQTWCPHALRKGVTDFLEAIIRKTELYRCVQVEIFRAVADCGAERIVDLCAGSGGPWLTQSWRVALARHAPLTVVLTDKFPDYDLSVRLAGEPAMCSIDFSVDAARVPASLHGFRTIFSSFHHFADGDARDVLADAVKYGDGFAMAEVTARTARAFVTMMALPFLVLILTPWMRPFRWSRLLLTYILPLIPLVVGWDGVVSCFRTRTPQELLMLTRDFPEYEWRAGYASGSWLPPVYLIGRPRFSSDPKRNG